jgi:hypothetical protein
VARSTAGPPPPRQARLRGRGEALLLVALLAGIVGVALVGRPDPPPRASAQGLAAALAVRDETRPRLGEIPDLRLMGDEPAASRDRLCDSPRDARMREMISDVAQDGVFVDEQRWRELPAGARAGLASFWSKCLHAGAAVHVRADGDGALLAVYDPDSGLQAD